jgi:hypothetical protein
MKKYKVIKEIKLSKENNHILLADNYDETEMLNLLEKNGFIEEVKETKKR